MRKYKLADRWPKNERGEWIDASGDPITHERIMRHAESIKIQIIKHFPKGYCQNSREEFEALFNNGFEEVLLSLLKFDKNECLSKVNSNSSFKRQGDQERLDWKQKNPEQAVLQGEHEWVMKALNNYYRRYRHDHSEKKRGGIEIPIPASDWINECYAKEMDGSDDASSFGPHLGAEVIPMRDFSTSNTVSLDRQTIFDLEMLKETYETDGREAALDAYNALSPDRKENVGELLKFTVDQDSGHRDEYLAKIYADRQQEAQEAKDEQQREEAKREDIDDEEETA